jgi:hypothetical protein
METTEQFDAAVQLVREQDLDSIVCGPDLDRFLEGLGRFEKAGFDHVWIHQVGPDQEAFLEFAARELLPRLRGASRG